jgi:hypothetical protein
MHPEVTHIVKIMLTNVILKLTAILLDFLHTRHGSLTLMPEKVQKAKPGIRKIAG